MLHEVKSHVWHWDHCWARMLVGMQGKFCVGMELGQCPLLGPAQAPWGWRDMRFGWRKELSELDCS